MKLAGPPREDVSGSDHASATAHTHPHKRANFRMGRKQIEIKCTNFTSDPIQYHVQMCQT
eukprot:5777928-Amphidinium_carterae.1